MVSQSASDWNKMAREDVRTVQTPCEMRAESSESMQPQSQGTVCFKALFLEIASHPLYGIEKF